MVVGRLTSSSGMMRYNGRLSWLPINFAAHDKDSPCHCVTSYNNHESYVHGAQNEQ